MGRQIRVNITSSVSELFDRRKELEKKAARFSLARVSTSVDTHD
ncbi:hypothetical protein M595_4829 [Lyngbya aestuarii BL J]|uniref:Uncharacterized protein n=1 Tax=Lyngbya aestuarii BL J TaxID=1348334 RepID=U7QDW4_9CYAN|nr:hypothetical protein M595_4829 [Lyngbya aestuarii BL J]